MKNFHLGNEIKVNKITNEKFYLSADDFSRHAFICGSTGTGKTVLGKIIVEEAAKAGVSAIIVDLKGDLSSLAVPIFDFVPDEIMPWLNSNISEEEKVIEARDFLNRFKQKLKYFDIPVDTIRKFRQQTRFNIFTPRSKKGTKFSISELYSPPEDIMEYADKEPEVVTGMIQNIAISLIERLYPGRDIRKLTVELVFLEEIIKDMWLKKEKLDGISGIELLVKRIYETKNEIIGKLPLDDFFPPDKRMDLLRRMNSLLLGSQRNWFEGISITQIIRNISSEDHTNISIFNLTELDSFADRSLVVSQLAYSIYNVYRKTNSEHLKLLFYIDEIGGSDNNAFFPPEPFHNIAKPGINLLLRQGRAFGVGTLLATQNPGDIDYKGLTNCHTWFIGKLQTEEDRKKILEGISRAEIRIDQAQDIMRDADEGCFLVRTRNGKVLTFLERWLYSLHRILGEDDISQLKQSLANREEYVKGYELLKSEEYEKAVVFFQKRIIDDPYEPGNYFALSNALLALDRIDEAIEVLKRSEKRVSSKEETHLELGNLYYMKNDLETARDYYESCVKQNPENDRALYLSAKTELFFMRLEKALEFIISATRYNYQKREYWVLKAKILLYMEKYKSALEAINTALEFQTDNSENLCFKAYLLFKMNDIEECRNIVSLIKEKISEYYVILALLEKDFATKEEYLKKALSISKTSLNALCELSLLYSEHEKYDEAIDCINNALEIEPYNPEYWFIKANIFSKQSQINAAVMCVDKSLRIKRSAEYLCLKARLMATKNDMSEAVSLYKEALKINSSDISVFIPLSKIMLDINTDEALKIIKRAIDIKKTSELFYLKSKALFKLNFPKEAIDSIDEAISLKPDSLNLYRYKSELYKKMGNYEKAIKNYINISEKFGEKAEKFYQIADCYLLQKKYSEALKICDEGIDKFPRSIKLWEVLKNVYKAMGTEEKALYCDSRINSLKE